MTFTVLIKRSAEKEYKALPIQIQKRIADAIKVFTENPFPPNARKLQNRDACLDPSLPKAWVVKFRERMWV